MSEETKKPFWMSWLAMSFAAGVGGAFALLTYVHAQFIDHDTMHQHLQQPHKGAVTADRYESDIQYIREQITEINRKFDQVLIDRQNR